MEEQHDIDLLIEECKLKEPSESKAKFLCKKVLQSRD
jgi:hypothetical protein